MKYVQRMLPVLIGIALALPAIAATAPASNQYQHIKNTWNVPGSAYPDCSTTVTTSCLSSYAFTAVDPTGASNVATVPNGGIAAGGVVSYTWGPGGYLYCGTWSTSVVAVYLDSSGASVSSSPVTSTAAVPCPLVASPAADLVSTPAP